jgi:hypothetical protein
MLSPKHKHIAWIKNISKVEMNEVYLELLDQKH